jgi:RNA polymerase sigma factor (sigma-70 family)
MELGTSVPGLDRESLHRELLPRVAALRRYVHGRIPLRLRATISADDVLQDVWLSAYRTVSTFTPDGPDAVERWLMTIANSKLIDAIRWARREKRGGDREHIRDVQRRVSSLSNLFSRVRSPQRTPSSAFSTIENAHAISIALNHLSRDHRRAVYLRHIEGRSRKQIASDMETTEATVNSLLYHGLRELRLLLGDAAKYFSDARSSQGGTLG